MTDADSKRGQVVDETPIRFDTELYQRLPMRMGDTVTVTGNDLGAVSDQNNATINVDSVTMS
ncbi:hypothetical protein [Lactiplantibacillus garii]|uniref:hypothetical protein n=1 Tax=Lactiplantibacillus garii TaxID=2306423 RepID=UPI000F62BDCE|nr:hypothetical protein [Lactiplantibacillus garii]